MKFVGVNIENKLSWAQNAKIICKCAVLNIGEMPEKYRGIFTISGVEILMSRPGINKPKQVGACAGPMRVSIA